MLWGTTLLMKKNFSKRAEKHPINTSGIFPHHCWHQKQLLLVWSVQHPRRSAVSGTPLLCWTINFIKDISKRHFRTISKLSIFFSLWFSAWFWPLLWVCNRFSLEASRPVGIPSNLPRVLRHICHLRREVFCDAYFSSFVLSAHCSPPSVVDKCEFY